MVYLSKVYVLGQNSQWTIYNKGGNIITLCSRKMTAPTKCTCETKRRRGPTCHRSVKRNADKVRRAAV